MIIVIFMNKIPIEVQNLIYKFLNPISKPLLRNLNGQLLDWCSLCGEYLGDNSNFCVRILIDTQYEYRCLNCFNSRE